MNVSGKKVAVLVDNYFEQAEFEEPISALVDAGADVTVVSASGKKLRGLNHIDKGDDFEADLLLNQANSDDYHALVLPGGAINADALRTNEKAQRWVQDFLDSGRPVAVICHAPWLMVSADAVEGRKLTSWGSIKDDIMNAGGDWMDKPVVIDKNLITSRKPEDIPLFNEALIKMLAKQPSDSLSAGSAIRSGLDFLDNDYESITGFPSYDREVESADVDLDDDTFRNADWEYPAKANTGLKGAGFKKGQGEQ